MINPLKSEYISIINLKDEKHEPLRYRLKKKGVKLIVVDREKILYIVTKRIEDFVSEKVLSEVGNVE
jgi:hypothetical protein